MWQRAAKPKEKPVQEGAVDPVDYCLECWKIWMCGDPDRDLGAKTARGLVGNSDGHGVDIHEAQQVHDMKIAEATDAMINSLPRIQIWALCRLCSVSTVWLFVNADLLTVGAEARTALAEKLKRNVCTGSLF
jgi:hypothetical protein